MKNAWKAMNANINNGIANDDNLILLPSLTLLLILLKAVAIAYEGFVLSFKRALCSSALNLLVIDSVSIGSVSSPCIPSQSQSLNLGSGSTDCE